MIRSEKKVKELSALLSRENSLLICEGIGLLREEEPFEGAIGLLASYYDTSEELSIRKTIEEFLNDLKDQSVTGEIMAEARKPYRPATIAMLIASCWQSGLDYSGFSADLIDIFLKSDFMTALECFTVLEEYAHELSISKRDEFIRIIGEYPPQISDEKTVLTKELISILKQEQE